MTERRQDDVLHRCAHAADRIELAHQRVSGIDLVIPIGADQQQMLQIRPSQQVLEKIERRHVQPLQIVEEERQWMLRPGEHAYEAPQDHWPLYELAEKLVDFEDYFRRWRFNHVTTVERVIGFKTGTGGTGGVSYLKRMLEVELFPELWRVRTVL